MLIPLLALAWTAHADPWSEVAATAEMPVDEVRSLVEGAATKQQSILDRMATPWEARPWHEYHPIFLNEARVEKGLAFWEAHAETLDRVHRETGVPPEVVVAIIGVETRYGEVMGNDAVLDALYTLGFHHERRGAFFRRELGHFLRLAKDEGWTLDEPRGSYAGAMGIGQFIPSSYRAYAVDGDGDGRRDLFDNPTDGIASVANYFVEHGWERDQPVLLEASVDGVDLDGLLDRGLSLTTTWGALEARGVEVSDPPEGDPRARLYDFDLADGAEVRVGLNNFYVITRYNHSKLYARVVHELSQQLAAGRADRLKSTAAGAEE